MLPLLTISALMLPATFAYALKPCPRSCNDSRQPAGSCLKRATWVGVGRIENVRERTMKAMGATFTFADFDFVVQRFEKGAHATRRVPSHTIRRVPSHTIHCYNSGSILKDPKGTWRMFARYPLDPSPNVRASYLHIERVTAANATLPSPTTAATTASPSALPDHTAQPTADPPATAAPTAAPTTPAAPPATPPTSTPPAACVYASDPMPSRDDSWQVAVVLACCLSLARRAAGGSRCEGS